jgi:hypothetical protein
MLYPILQPNDLGLILSYKCQSNCAHCIYNCGSGWEDWITEEAIEEALRATLVWDRPYQVHITGGEPFLNFPLLKHAVLRCADLGIPVYVETNAGWCVNEDLTHRRFTELRAVGLQAVQISCSPFHAAYIPPERVLLAIEQAAAVFSPHRVLVYMQSWLEEVVSLGATNTTPLEVYIDQYGAETAGRLFWEGYGLISGGRAGYRLGDLTHRYPAEYFQGQNCRGEILFAPHSHFDLYGNFIPGFCGGITVGSWRGLEQVTSNFQQGIFPELLEILIDSGPFGLFECGQKIGYTQLPEGYSGKCHLCVDVRAFLEKTGEYDELQPANFYTFLPQNQE